MKTLLLASTLAVFGDKLDQIEGLNLSECDVLCIPTAALHEEPRDWLEGELEPVRSRAKHYTEFDITGKSEEEVRAVCAGKDVIYSPGGNTYCLLEQIRACNFDKILEEHLAKGGIYMGGSAGAIAVCPDIDYVRSIDEPEKSNLTTYEGLGIINMHIMPHIDGKDFREPIEKIINKTKDIPIIGLKDDQAIFIKDNYWKIY